MSKREDDSLLLKHKKSKNEYMLRNFASNIEGEIASLIELLKKRQKIKNQHILSLIEMKTR